MNLMTLVAPDITGQTTLKKDKLRDLNFQIKYHISDLKASMYVLKQTLLSCNCRAETVENPPQNLILPRAELQGKLNSQPHRGLPVK